MGQTFLSARENAAHSADRNVCPTALHRVSFGVVRQRLPSQRGLGFPNPQKATAFFGKRTPQTAAGADQFSL